MARKYLKCIYLVDSHIYTYKFIYIYLYIYIYFIQFILYKLYIYMQLYKFIQILYNFGIGVMWAVLFCSDKMWLCNIRS